MAFTPIGPILGGGTPSPFSNHPPKSAGVLRVSLFDQKRVPSKKHTHTPKYFCSIAQPKEIQQKQWPER